MHAAQQLFRRSGGRRLQLVCFQPGQHEKINRIARPIRVHPWQGGAYWFLICPMAIRQFGFGTIHCGRHPQNSHEHAGAHKLKLYGMSVRGAMLVFAFPLNKPRFAAILKP